MSKVRMNPGAPRITARMREQGVHGWRQIRELSPGVPMYQGVDARGRLMPGWVWGSGFPAAAAPSYKNIASEVIALNQPGGGTINALVITLNRPKAANFLDQATIAEINAALDQIDSTTQAVIFKGAGKHFCAGVSIEEHLDPAYQQTIPAFTALIKKIAALEVPTAALIQGNVMGGGAELITVFDYVIASEDVKIGFPETTLNVLPYIALVTLPRIVDDPAWALEAILDGSLVFTSQGALERKLVDKVVAPTNLTPQLAAEFLAGGKSARSERLKAPQPLPVDLEVRGREIIDGICGSKSKISREVLTVALQTVVANAVVNLATALDNAERVYLDKLMGTEGALRDTALAGLQGFLNRQARAAGIGGSLVVKKIDTPPPLDQARIDAVDARIAEITGSHRAETQEGYMWALRFNPRTKGLELKAVPIPRLRKGEVLVKIAACGGCGTDFHYIEGLARPIIQDRPLTLGHEASGEIALLEPGATDTSLLGRKVLIPAVLKDGRMVGSDIDGAYAEFIVFPADQLVPVPDDFPLIKGAVVADAVTTPYHAVAERAQLKPGEIAVVIGVGGVGINVVQTVKALGGIPVAVDIDGAKLDLAASLGAALTINTSRVDNDVKPHELAKAIAERVRRELGKLPAVAFEVIGIPSTSQLAIDLSLQGGRGIGRAVIIGFGGGEVRLRTQDIMYREAEVRGSYGCPVESYPAAVGLVNDAKISVDGIVTHAFTLGEYKQWLAAMHDAKNSGIVRGVFVNPSAYPEWWKSYRQSPSV